VRHAISAVLLLAALAVPAAAGTGGTVLCVAAPGPPPLPHPTVCVPWPFSETHRDLSAG